MFIITIVLLMLTGILVILKQINRFCPLTMAISKIKTIDGSSVEKHVAISYKHFWGNTFDLLSKNLEDTFNYNRLGAQQFKRNFMHKYMYCLIYNIIDPNDAELILNDPRAISKGFIYDYMQTFLQTGLLTSTDKKWHVRRRLLTPAFHFNLLPQFLDAFKRESLNFVNLLSEQFKDNNTEAIISLRELIPRFTLNVICEAAMGVKLENCLDGDEYRECIKELDEVVIRRIQNPLYVFDWLYFALPEGRNALKSVRKMHKFSSDIIEKRRILSEKVLNNNRMNIEDKDENIYRKQRYAMLDTLLMAEKDGLIDHAGICEEVDTVIFEGFDTTSMNLIFALMNLANFGEAQQKCYDEIQEYILDDLSNLNLEQLSHLKYLDCVIKETQRLYPSVALFSRKCVTDLPLANNLILPKGTQINIHVFDIQRNPKYFPNPDNFQPERFLADSEAEKRHPFAFIPFSAGQRNCIGQKFAMLEMKALLVCVIKNFLLKPVTAPESIRFSAGLLLRTNTDIQIQISKR